MDKGSSKGKNNAITLEQFVSIMAPLIDMEKVPTRISSSQIFDIIDYFQSTISLFFPICGFIFCCTMIDSQNKVLDRDYNK